MDQTTTTQAVEATTPKAPSKKSQAVVIFTNRLAERAQGLFGDNRSFRAAVLNDIEVQLGVSRASAATMYNSCKKEVEADGTTTLGRDPKKVKISTGTGKKGRPAGSKNRPKVAPVITTETTVEAPATTEVVA